ncbi:MAG: cadherin repeat domain-containing protein [Flammeovirgaceae bacterium]|nr:cadherin repeat domain-containing protein [Flammeovirgaceae bacterium]
MKKYLALVALTTLTFLNSCDEEDAPPVVQVKDFEVTIDENPANGFVLGKLEATTDKGTLTFTLTSESVEGAFEVDAEKGELKVKDKSKFDFETTKKITAIVTVKNGSVEKTINITVNLKDSFNELVVNNLTYDLSNANLYWTGGNSGHSQTHERHILLITDGVFSGNNYIGNDQQDFPNGYTYKVTLYVYPAKGTDYSIQNTCEITSFNGAEAKPGKWAVGYLINAGTKFILSTEQYTGTPKVLFNYKQNNNGVFDIEGPLYINIPQSTGTENYKVELRFDGKYKKIF